LESKVKKEAAKKVTKKATTDAGQKAAENFFYRSMMSKGLKKGGRAR
jgi:hypothetical protein